MSINRDMKKYILQRCAPERTDSGAEKEKWEYVREIDVAVYKKNEFKTITSEKYAESTHTGLTSCKNIRANDNRLVKDGVIYLITDCNTEGRLTNLILKVIMDV